MNDLISVIILAIIQGATEWLPVSSSGHLVLFSNLLNFEGGLAFDVTLHLGTLLAVIIYFWKDLFGILKSLLRLDFKLENGKLFSFCHWFCILLLFQTTFQFNRFFIMGNYHNCFAFIPRIF